MNLEDVDWLYGDEDASYCRVMTYQAEELVPVCACPSQVDNIHPVSELVGTEINQVFIGSCTNGRLKAGYMETLAKAGAIITQPGCGLCCGRSGGILCDGEKVLATNNRNFLGRMGTSKVGIYLGSPATAATSAIYGKITIPE